MKKNFRFSLFFFVVLFSAVFAGAQDAVKKIPVKVLVLDMFEVGNNQGDTAGEFQHYYEKYFSSAASYTINSQPLVLYVNGDGVAGCVTGMGKAQSASSLTAILADNRFDFTNTYILVSGCGGMPAARGTLGDVIIADGLVDYELGHAWSELDAPQGTTATFMRDKSYDRPGYIKMNPGLVNWAYKLTESLALTDDPSVDAIRAKYDETAEKPVVRVGISVTGDSYWSGAYASAHADEVCAAYGAGPYMVTQMEDNAFGVVAMNYGKLDRLIVCRDTVDFDKPYEGQTVVESLNSSFGAFSMGMSNGFTVGSAIVDYLVANWDVCRDTIPSVE